jgi:protein O-mannosyl-transferase
MASRKPAKSLRKTAPNAPSQSAVGRSNQLIPANSTIKQPPQAPPSFTSPQPVNQNLFLRYGLLLALVVLVTIAFSFGFGNDFVDWDDMEYVVENRFLTNPATRSLAALWRTPIALNYHPLTMTTLYWNAVLFGTGPKSFIVTNLILHVINTLLVFLLASQLAKQNQITSFFIALIWGLHPMHVESVIWVSERKDVLYTLFFLLACLSYLRYRRTEKSGWLLLTGGLFVLSCLSKAMAVMLPVVLLLIDYLEGRDLKNRATWLEKLPFFLIALGFGIVAVQVQRGGDLGGFLATGISQTKDAVGREPFSWRWLVYGSYGFTMYLVRFLAPIHLSAFYPYPADVQQITAKFWVGPIVFMGYLGVLVWAFWQNRRTLAFGLSFFLVTIILVLQFMTVGAAYMAERYSYLPFFGLLFWIMTGLEQRTRPNATNRLALRVGAGVFAIVCFYQTSKQVQVWKNTETLWFNALEYFPDNDQIHEGLGDYYGKRNEIDKAIGQFSAALNGGTNRYHVYEGLGNAYGLKGDVAKAAEMFGEALKLDSTQGDIYYNRGITIMRSRPADAVRDFNTALQIMPEKDTLVRPSRGFALLQTKDYAAAKADYDFVLQQKATDAIALHNRGVCKFNLGDRPGAIADIRQALALKPDYEEAARNLKALSGE